MHEIPWNAKPTFSSASVISETLYADKMDYFFHFHYSSRTGFTPRVRAITQCLPTGCRCILFSFPLLQWSSFFGVVRFFDMNVGGLRTKLPPVFFGFFAPALTVMRPDFLAWRK